MMFMTLVLSMFVFYDMDGDCVDDRDVDGVVEGDYVDGLGDGDVVDDDVDIGGVR